MVGTVNKHFQAFHTLAFHAFSCFSNVYLNQRILPINFLFFSYMERPTTDKPNNIEQS